MVATELVSHPHLGRLADHVARTLLEAARTREPARMAAPPDPEQAPSPEQAETPHGNVLEILERGPREPHEIALIAALAAHGLASSPPTSEQAWQELAASLAWLAAYTPFITFDALEELLGERARSLFNALGALAKAPAELGAGRPEALVAAAALASSRSEMARQTVAWVARHTADPLVRAACRVGDAPKETRLVGELRMPPPGPVLTTLLAVTGLLLLGRGLGFLARFGLGLKRPAALCLTARGLELTSSVHLLGRTLNQRQVIVPIGQLARATRELKYARLGLYAGLVAIALGSYFGMGLVVDGLRVPGSSPPLLGLGVLLVVAGLVLDFGLSRLSDAVRGQCRLIVVPRKGRSFCVGALDLGATDQMLRQLARGAAALPPSASPPLPTPDAPSQPVTALTKHDQ